MTIRKKRKTRKNTSEFNLKKAVIKFIVVTGLIVISLVVIAYAPDSNAESVENILPITQPALLPPLYLDVPSEFMQAESSQIDTLIDTLRNTSNPNIIIRDTGYGGETFLVNNFMRAIDDATNAGKHISMDVVGPAYSGHAYITCALPDVTIRPGASLMFHEPFSIDTFLFGLVPLKLIMADINEDIQTDHIYELCVKNGRLTAKDVETLKKGDDVIITNEGGVLKKYYIEDGFNLLTSFSELMKLLLDISFIIVIIGLIKKI